LLPESLVPGWKSWLRRAGRKVGIALAISLAAWVGSMPLTAYYFHVFSWITLPVNLLVVPLSSCALAANVGSLLGGSLFPGVPELLNHSAWFFMKCMMWLSEAACRAPLGCVFLKSPGLAAILGYYAGVGALLAAALLPLRQRLLVAGTVVVLCAGWCVHRYAQSRLPTLSIVPVDSGAAVYAHGSRSGEDWLIDPGRTNSVQFTIKPFLRAQGVNRLEALVLTHGDVQHMGGAQLVERLFNPRVTTVSSLRFRSPVYRKVVAELEQRPNCVQKVAKGDHLGSWTMLHPEPGDKPSRADDGALVLLGNIKGCRVLLLSDLGWTGQELLMQRWPELRADLVISGLPANESPLREPLLDLIQPQIIVVCDAEYPALARAKPELKQRLERRHLPVLYTRDCGAVKVVFGEGGWTVTSMDNVADNAKPFTISKQRGP